MEEWPDDHLDDLFRKSAEEYDVPYNPTDWPDLARRLDDHNRLTWFDHISRWGGISALLLLLFGGLGWMAYGPTAAGVHQQTVVARASRPSAPSAGADRVIRREQTAQSDRPQPTNVPAEEDQNQRAVVMAAQPKSDEVIVNMPNPPARQQTTRRRQASVLAETIPRSERQRTRAVSVGQRDKLGTVLPRRVVGNSTQRSTNRRSGPAQATRLAEGRLGAAPQLRHGSMGVGTTDSRVPGETNQLESVAKTTLVGSNSTEPTSLLAGSDAHWLPAIAELDNLSGIVQSKRNIPEVVEPDLEKPVRRIMPKLSRFSAFVFVSPDLSTVGLKNFYEPGSNMGVSVQYQLSDRLSLHTGVMLSRKRYETYSSEYVFPWNWDVMPTDIYGDCRMLDVPLNLRYDWLLRPRGDGRAPARWFVSAGATSYFIQRETYTYEYENPNDPRIKRRGWDNLAAGRDGGSFGFSNINLSVGYERPISRRLSWQVEPFMKVPLKQIGFFKIRLVSTGAFAGLRYRF